MALQTYWKKRRFDVTSEPRGKTGKRGGKELPDIIFAVLDSTRAGDPLPATSAWTIDQKHAKFVKISTDGLLCPRSGIYSVDGGL